MLAIKLVVGIAVVVLLVFELGSPLITRYSVDNQREKLLEVANYALSNAGMDANAAFPALAAELSRTQNVRLVNLSTSSQAEVQGSSGTVTIVVEKEASSPLVAKVIPSLSDYYKVQVEISGPIR